MGKIVAELYAKSLAGSIGRRARFRGVPSHAIGLAHGPVKARSARRSLTGASSLMNTAYLSAVENVAAGAFDRDLAAGRETGVQTRVPEPCTWRRGRRRGRPVPFRISPLRRAPSMLWASANDPNRSDRSCTRMPPRSVAAPCGHAAPPPVPVLRAWCRNLAAAEGSKPRRPRSWACDLRASRQRGRCRIFPPDAQNLNRIAAACSRPSLRPHAHCRFSSFLAAPIATL
jgi:hypothetical protein